MASRRTDTTDRRPVWAVMGGAFDPPHQAHRALIEAVLGEGAADHVVVVPTGEAWHKSRPLSAGGHRLAMARLAFGDHPGVSISDCELRRTGPSYTVDTLEDLRRAHPGVDWLLVLGSDQASRLDTWHRASDVLRLARLAVAQRPGEPAAPLPPNSLTLPMPALDLSSTRIRSLAAKGCPLDGLVTPAVAGYIDTHHLYQTH